MSTMQKICALFSYLLTG
uniref:Uncharacterized protein n=1 Tax=Rhizophora mucronata TaxID=61149 RepID=A0A2P2NFL2_RHIMU